MSLLHVGATVFGLVLALLALFGLFGALVVIATSRIGEGEEQPDRDEHVVNGRPRW